MHCDPEVGGMLAVTLLADPPDLFAVGGAADVDPHGIGRDLG